MKKNFPYLLFLLSLFPLPYLPFVFLQTSKQNGLHTSYMPTHCLISRLKKWRIPDLKSFIAAHPEEPCGQKKRLPHTWRSPLALCAHGFCSLCPGHGQPQIPSPLCVLCSIDTRQQKQQPTNHSYHGQGQHR